MADAREAGLLAEFMRALDDPSLFARVAPDLSIGREIAAEEAPFATNARDDLAQSVDRLARDGWLELRGAASGEDARSLVTAIDALGVAGLPPLFVYVFDRTWQIGARVAAALSGALGARYALLADAWAFRVAPGPEHAGWSPHRGSYALAPNRRAPDLLNVWIALSDATIDNSCMHVVPLEADAAYPDDLASHAAHPASGVAVPVTAGTALVWNANVLHWGGASSARATEPRVSVTFTLQRDGVGVATPLDLHALDRRARLDVISDQILIYGDADPTLPDVVRRWASVSDGLRKALNARRAGPPT